MTATRRLAWIWFVLTPICWMAQGAAAWYVTGRACPAAAPPLSFAAARWLIVLFTAAALTSSVGALTAAGRILRHPDGAVEGERGAVRSIPDERRRFAAMSGMVIGVTLTLGLLLAGLPAVVLHACAEPR